MKPDIHPKYSEITVTCSCGKIFKVGSTLGKDLSIEVCDQCHPFYSGQQKIITTGRVEKYKSRYETPRPAQVQPTKPAIKKEVKKAKKGLKVVQKKEVAKKIETPVKKEVKKTKPVTKTKETKKKETQKTKE